MSSDRERLPSFLPGYDIWSHEHVDHLTDLVHVAVPEAGLTPDDLLCLWTAAEESIVLVKAGAAAIAGHIEDDRSRLTLLAVDPGCRREGIARELVAWFEDWSRAKGATTVEVGAPLGYGPWVGIDSESADVRAFFGALGYEVEAQPALVCHAIPTRFRADTPPTVEIVRAMPESVVDETVALVRRHAEHHRSLFELAIEQGTCFVARKPESGLSLAVLCHSVIRTAWIGPVAIIDDDLGPDLMPALVSAACTDLMVAGQATAHLLGEPPIAASDLARLNATPGPTFLRSTNPLAPGTRSVQV